MEKHDLFFEKVSLACDAFIAAGNKVEPNSFGEEKKDCGCALTALGWSIEPGIMFSRNRWNFIIWHILPTLPGITENEAWAFLCGFDIVEEDRLSPSEKNFYEAGFRLRTKLGFPIIRSSEIK